MGFRLRKVFLTSATPSKDIVQGQFKKSLKSNISKTVLRLRDYVNRRPLGSYLSGASIWRKYFRSHVTSKGQTSGSNPKVPRWSSDAVVRLDFGEKTANIVIKNRIVWSRSCNGHRWIARKYCAVIFNSDVGSIEQTMYICTIVFYHTV